MTNGTAAVAAAATTISSTTPDHYFSFHSDATQFQSIMSCTWTHMEIRDALVPRSTKKIYRARDLNAQLVYMSADCATPPGSITQSRRQGDGCLQPPPQDP